MSRFLYFAGFAYIALCGAVVARKVASYGARIRTVDTVVTVAPPRPAIGMTSGAQWFAATKSYCNQVEVDIRARNAPPPPTSDGAAYAAACFALAGKIARAREAIESIPPSERASAANVLFAVAHPVADAGDDIASGPMMELVLEYWPNNYMALYHAGMSEYALGDKGLAVTHLQTFLQLYTARDYFRESAERTLKAIDDGLPGRMNRRPRPVERERPARP